MPSMQIIWLIAAIVFGALEAATMGLTAIWFAAGSLAAMLVAMLNGGLWLQIAVFIAVSAAILYLTRDLANKYINKRHERTNADRVVGMEGVVVEQIDNDLSAGQIRVAGQVWTARCSPSSGNSRIEAGAHIRVDAIEGVKAMVSRVPAPENPKIEEEKT